MLDSPSVFLAFTAGFVSFVSPCCLPLVPGYLAAISPGGEGEARARRRQVLLRSAMFVASFSAVFIALGLTATALGSFLAGNQVTLRKVAGVAIIAMGLFFIASIFVTRLNRDFRSQSLAARARRSGPVVAGLAFALAWTPCVGPTLGAILGLASTSGTTAEAGGLLAIYSAGLAVPFLLVAAGFDAAERGFGWLKRHYTVVQGVAGVVLVVMGVLVYTNELYRLNIEALKLLDGLGLNFFRSI